MGIRRRSHSRSWQTSEPPTRRTGLGAIVATQHVLLWSSAYVSASETYLLIEGYITPDLLPSSIVLLVSAAISVLYIAAHGVSAFLSSRVNIDRKRKLRLTAHWVATSSLRLGVTAWLAACGMSIIFTIAKQPYCTRRGGAGVVKIDVGSTCIIQRTGVGASLMSLLATLVLFVLMHKTSDPFRCHLFGITKEPMLLPLMLPYKSAPGHTAFSEMSFKCRSSSSLSSHTLIPSRSNSLSHLIPSCPEKAAFGLGIYAPKQSTRSFLAPRPSLQSIRTHTTISSLPPPSSPLPPLPAYFPERYRQPSAMQKAIYPPRSQQPYQLARSQSGRTVRMVPPSPALSASNLAAFNRSTESLSSVYSRSISGETRHPEGPGALSESSRSFSSGSAATLVKSPLVAMRRAADPNTIVMPGSKSGSCSDDFESEVDDAATLQAKLPSVKAVSEFGEVENWPLGRQVPMSYCQRTTVMDEKGVLRRLDFTPLTIGKTRGSGAAVPPAQYVVAAA
ncbi:hypothetical protein LTR91_009480 [Friedmanniomyces endolithicus]|uniref:Uncharacterized protein n=1 Tax=Friedmanniomyces endolithicus TaxID=329885 RepID=A0AAN6KKG5_9PEZI|nr:hypothetical protein LTR57_020431 [Friedmanniomyces endolithicus]KAK0965259.1 hypothetical protein LTS01_018404 [Friedmanniomyces endolithicus]KAK0988595.1 hypothetical protein LTR91_009480 [Friedmanniomyces endolithicus]KAK1037612.1 hypothetical protein LTS16_012670 [Friedmanniomyces endolithicus]